MYFIGFFIILSTGVCVFYRQDNTHRQDKYNISLSLLFYQHEYAYSIDMSIHNRQNKCIRSLPILIHRHGVCVFNRQEYTYRYRINVFYRFIFLSTWVSVFYWQMSIHIDRINRFYSFLYYSINMSMRILLTDEYVDRINLFYKFF